MNISVNIDDMELRTLGTWLREAGPEVNQAAPGVLRKAAVNIKDEWQEAARKSRHFALAHTINFDERDKGDVLEVEVGPDRTIMGGKRGKGSPAQLAGIAHFGGANGGGGTLGDPQRFLDSEAPRMADALNKIVGDALA